MSVPGLAFHKLPSSSFPFRLRMWQGREVVYDVTVQKPEGLGAVHIPPIEGGVTRVRIDTADGHVEDRPV